MDALDEAGVLEQLVSRLDINDLVETGLSATSQHCRSAVLAYLRAANAGGGGTLEVLSPLLALARAPEHMLPLEGASVSAEHPLVSVPGETLICVPLNRTGLSTLGAAVLQLAPLPGGAIAARPFAQHDGMLTPGSTRILLGPRVAFAQHSSMLLVSGCICSEDEPTMIVALPPLAADDESPSNGVPFQTLVCSLFEEVGVEEEFVEVYLPNFPGTPVVCKLAPGTVTDISSATFASLGLSPFPGKEAVFSMTLDVDSSAVTVMATPSNRTIWVGDDVCEYKKASDRTPANSPSLPEGESVFFSPFTPPPPPSRSRRGQGQSTDTAPRAPKAGDKGFEFAMAWRFATRYMVAPKAAEATREPAGAQLSSTSVAAPGPSVEGEFVA